MKPTIPQQLLLLKLAKKLNRLPASYTKFSLDVFYHRHGKYQPPTKKLTATIHQTGTIACAICHAPSFGIPVPKGVKKWSEYALQVFGLTRGSREFKYLFSKDWVGVDNTPQGVAARIANFIANDCTVPRTGPNKRIWL